MQTVREVGTILTLLADILKPLDNMSASRLSLQSMLEEMADLGPGRYDIPDEWQKGFKPIAGKIR